MWSRDRRRHCNPIGQACDPDIGYLRLNILTTVQTAAMGQIPRSIERILVEYNSLLFRSRAEMPLTTDSQQKYNNYKMPCYRKDDRAMRPIAYMGGM